MSATVELGTGGTSTDRQLPVLHHQLPGNAESVEKFPEYCLPTDGIIVTAAGTTQKHSNANHVGNITSIGQDRAIFSQGRPSSLSIQSVPSSEYSSSSSYSDKDNNTPFDSRRSSIISSASSHTSYLSQSQHTQPLCSSPEEQEQKHQHQQLPLKRNRRDAKQLHADRLQRSGSTSLNIGKKDGSPNSKSRRFRKNSANPADALAATEPPHEQGLTRMAFAEQQRWITVQQKTFTKWLNTKLESRSLEVKDLVTDLSDGVCSSRTFSVTLQIGGVLTSFSFPQLGDINTPP